MSSSSSPSMAQIRASLPPQKDRLDSLWLRFALRKLSFPMTWVFIRLGFSANYVSYLSVLVSVVGLVMMSIDDHVVMVTGACLFNLWALLDCVDGNVARVKAQLSEYGVFVDALGGYVAFAFVFLGMGIAAEHTKPLVPVFLNQIDFAVIGGFTSICQLTTRLIYKKFVEASRQSTMRKGTGPHVLFTNLGVTGLLMPVVLVGAILGWLHWAALFYLVCYGGAFVYLIVTKIVAVERAIRRGEDR